MTPRYLLRAGTTVEALNCGIEDALPRLRAVAEATGRQATLRRADGTLLARTGKWTDDQKRAEWGSGERPPALERRRPGAHGGDALPARSLATVGAV